MSVDRRDSAALISIGALRPVGPLRTGNREREWEWEGWESGFEEASREEGTKGRFDGDNAPRIQKESALDIRERKKENKRTGSRAAATSQGLAPMGVRKVTESTRGEAPENRRTRAQAKLVQSKPREPELVMPVNQASQASARRQREPPDPIGLERARYVVSKVA
jgi:hypothetical protein